VHKADTPSQADRPSQADTPDTVAEEAGPELQGLGQEEFHPSLPAENSHKPPTQYR